MSVLINGTNGLIQAYDYQTPATGFSYTFAAGTQTLVMNPAATLATGTITMPAAPSDGMTITISTTKQITSLTLNGNTGQSILGAVTSMAPYQVVAFVYRAANTSWFPTMTQVAQPAGPAFYGYLNQTQAFTGGVYTKVQLNAELFDTASAFDTSTYRFTPQIAGYYQINAQASSITSTYSGDNIVAIYKNGTAYTLGYVATYGIPNVSNLVYMNGSTDYLELYMRLGTSQNMAASATGTYLSGSLVRAA